MGRYIKASADKRFIWIIWILQTCEIDGSRSLHSVHATRKGATQAEGMLIRDEYQYYSIERKELYE